MKKITLSNRVTNFYFNFAFFTNICGFLSFKFIRKIIVINNICQSSINLKAYDLRDGNEGIYIENSFQAETREGNLKFILIKKYLLPILLFLFSLASVAQLKQQLPYKLDTIFANEKKSVALFFPNPIRQAITGAEHFTFNYNREKQQYFGLLQATPGVESNLLTITENGQVYSYILKYKKQLKQLNYFISEKERIGVEKPIEVTIKQQKPIINEQAARVPNYQKFSEYLLSSTLKNIATNRKKGVKVQLQKIAYNASEVYLVIEIRNNSKIDFEIDYLNVYGTNGNKKKKASYQSLPLKAIYKHKMPSFIQKGQNHKFVYVLPKFVLGDNEILQIQLQDLNGSRKVVFKDFS